LKLAAFFFSSDNFKNKKWELSSEKRGPQVGKRGPQEETRAYIQIKEKSRVRVQSAIVQKQSIASTCHM
jgi:hypothetical protein